MEQCRPEAWTLADDGRLLLAMEDLSVSLSEQVVSLSSQIDSLSLGADSARVSLENVSNQLMLMSRERFVETQIASVSVPADSAPVRSVGMVSSTEERDLVAEALRLGTDYLSRAYHVVHVSESESDSSDEESAVIWNLEPRDVYFDRPLPYIVGSAEYEQDDYAGLGRTLALVDEPENDELLEDIIETEASDTARRSGLLSNTESPNAPNDEVRRDNRMKNKEKDDTALNKMSGVSSSNILDSSESTNPISEPQKPSISDMFGTPDQILSSSHQDDRRLSIVNEDKARKDIDCLRRVSNQDSSIGIGECTSHGHSKQANLNTNMFSQVTVGDNLGESKSSLASNRNIGSKAGSTATIFSSDSDDDLFAEKDSIKTAEAHKPSQCGRESLHDEDSTVTSHSSSKLPEPIGGFTGSKSTYSELFDSDSSEDIFEVLGGTSGSNPVRSTSNQSTNLEKIQIPVATSLPDTVLDNQKFVLTTDTCSKSSGNGRAFSTLRSDANNSHVPNAESVEVNNVPDRADISNILVESSVSKVEDRYISTSRKVDEQFSQPSPSTAEVGVKSLPVSMKDSEAKDVVHNSLSTKLKDRCTDCAVDVNDTQSRISEKTLPSVVPVSSDQMKNSNVRDDIREAIGVKGQMVSELSAKLNTRSDARVDDISVTKSNVSKECSPAVIAARSKSSNFSSLASVIQNQLSKGSPSKLVVGVSVIDGQSISCFRSKDKSERYLSGSAEYIEKETENSPRNRPDIVEVNDSNRGDVTNDEPSLNDQDVSGNRSLNHLTKDRVRAPNRRKPKRFSSNIAMSSPWNIPATDTPHEGLSAVSAEGSYNSSKQSSSTKELDTVDNKSSDLPSISKSELSHVPPQKVLELSSTRDEIPAESRNVSAHDSIFDSDSGDEDLYNPSVVLVKSSINLRTSSHGSADINSGVHGESSSKSLVNSDTSLYLDFDKPYVSKDVSIGSLPSAEKRDTHEDVCSSELIGAEKTITKVSTVVPVSKLDVDPVTSPEIVYSALPSDVGAHENISANYDRIYSSDSDDDLFNPRPSTEIKRNYKITEPNTNSTANVSDGSMLSLPEKKTLEPLDTVGKIHNVFDNTGQSIDRTAHAQNECENNSSSEVSIKPLDVPQKTSRENSEVVSDEQSHSELGNCEIKSLMESDREKSKNIAPSLNADLPQKKIDETIDRKDGSLSSKSALFSSDDEDIFHSDSQKDNETREIIVPRSMPISTENIWTKETKNDPVNCAESNLSQPVTGRVDEKLGNDPFPVSDVLTRLSDTKIVSNDGPDVSSNNGKAVVSGKGDGEQFSANTVKSQQNYLAGSGAGSYSSSSTHVEDVRLPAEASTKSSIKQRAESNLFSDDDSDDLFQTKPKSNQNRPGSSGSIFRETKNIAKSRSSSSKDQMLTNEDEDLFGKKLAKSYIGIPEKVNRSPVRPDLANIPVDLNEKLNADSNDSLSARTKEKLGESPLVSKSKQSLSSEFSLNNNTSSDSQANGSLQTDRTISLAGNGRKSRLNKSAKLFAELSDDEGIFSSGKAARNSTKVSKSSAISNQSRTSESRASSSSTPLPSADIDKTSSPVSKKSSLNQSSSSSNRRGPNTSKPTTLSRCVVTKDPLSDLLDD